MCQYGDLAARRHVAASRVVREPAKAGSFWPRCADPTHGNSMDRLDTNLIACKRPPALNPLEPAPATLLLRRRVQRGDNLEISSLHFVESFESFQTAVGSHRNQPVFAVVGYKHSIFLESFEDGLSMWGKP